MNTMKRNSQIILNILLFLLMIPSVNGQVDNKQLTKDTLTNEAGWDLKLYQQDVETYKQFKTELAVYPMTLSAFPVKNYDYAVLSTSAPFYENGHTYIRLNIGDYPDFNSDSTRIAGSLIFQVDELKTNENTFVQSRNWPYLTAQGTFEVDSHPFDWVFLETPDKNAYFMVNMKLFDLKLGKQVVIFPNPDGSFTYKQF